MRSIRTATMLLCFLALSSVAGAQVPEQLMAGRQNGEVVLKKLAETNYQDLGFSSTEESRAFETGTPLREFAVRLDELKAYKAGDDPLKLLGAGDEYTFPVFVGNEVKSSFMVAKTGDIWAPVSFGSPNRTKLIMTVLNESVSQKRPAASFFLVKVPALYYHFLAYREEGKLYLIPLLSDKSREFTAGKPLPAENVFEVLAPLAVKYHYPERPKDKNPPRDVR